MQRANRIGWIEWARALGAVGVVLLHVLTSTSLQVMDSISYARLIAYIDLSIVFGRWAVPAFFMITGYLLLNPAKEVGWERARKYALRMIWVLITFGFVFSLMEEASNRLAEGAPITLGIVLAAAIDVLSASSWDHLWYVYALVVVYMLVPLVRMVRDRLGERGLWYLSAVLYAGVLVIPTLVRFAMLCIGEDVWLPEEGLMALASNVAIGLTCLCVGGSLHKSFNEIPAVCAGVLSLIVMLAASTIGLLTQDADLGFVFLQGSCFACAYALAVLLILRRLLGNTPIRPNSAIDLLARDSFGIYVLHPLFVHLVLIKVDPIAFPPVVFELVFIVVVIAASMALTHLLRRIPFLGDLL